MCGKEGTLPASCSGTILRRRESKIQSSTFGGLGAGGAGAGGWVLLGPMGLLVPIYADQPGRLGKEALATLQGTTSPRFQQYL